MNIYLRYFENEILVQDVDQALAFLQSIPDIDVDDFMAEDLRSFVEGSVMYPKRYKVKARAYFIVIKTTAQTLEEFKEIGATAHDEDATLMEKRPKAENFMAIQSGWYEANINFKRVLTHPISHKSQYVDTEFVARVKAESVKDCYNKVLNHLRSRQDIDPRSQFPSIKGRNFMCTFIGEELTC